MTCFVVPSGFVGVRSHMVAGDLKTLFAESSDSSKRCEMQHDPDMSKARDGWPFHVEIAAGQRAEPPV